MLTRSQIIEAVWDFAYDGGSNVVDQYVNYLRRKIDAPFGRHDIETVRGMGYRLRHPQRARDMSIRLRLALAFAAAAALLFAVGGWLFAAALSSAQLRVIDSQLTAQLAQAARYLPGPAPTAGAAANAVSGEYMVQAIDAAGRVRGSPDAGTAPLLTAGELAQARRAQIWVTRTIDEENTRVTAAPMPGHPGWVAVAAVSLETYDATQSQVAAGARRRRCGVRRHRRRWEPTGWHAPRSPPSSACAARPRRSRGAARTPSWRSRGPKTRSPPSPER